MVWQLASEILADMDTLNMEEPNAMKIMSSYIANLVSHTDFLSTLIGKTKIRVPDGKGAYIERNLATELIQAKELFTGILSYSYGKGSKVSDIVKMLKESGPAQDFFHSESLLATFVLNKHILSHCGDDIVLYTQRDMCAVCEATWRKIADSFPIKGKIYVLSSEPYAVDESWKRHDLDGGKLIKIPTILVDKGDLRNQFVRNLLVQQRATKVVKSTSIAELYSSAKDLFLNYEKYLQQALSTMEFTPGEVHGAIMGLLERSNFAKIKEVDFVPVTLSFTKEQMLEPIMVYKERLISEQLQMDIQVFQNAGFDVGEKQKKNRLTAQKITEAYKNILDSCIKTISKLVDPQKVGPVFQQYKNNIAKIPETLKLQKADIPDEIWQKVLEIMNEKIESILGTLSNLTTKHQQVIGLK